MKKVLAIMAVAAVSISASADLTSFGYQGGKLFDASSTAFAAGTYVNGAKIFTTDLNSFVSGGQINLADISGLYATGDIAVGPVFAGGTYGTGLFEEDPATIAGQTVWLVFDANGGAIEVGDVIGIASSGDVVDALTPPVGAGDVQTFTPGDITSNVTVVIPEPATLGLMGVAGLGLFLARRKARR